ncbi:hypothetical protein GH741_00200 [Aquibacillus halophilus]|uniref:Uncharacterized protein n=1 Tax=Aquibacillus halophilus TaxID=930132 RepID=A0A6A8DIF4_9BACI|nr:hypothetical protein [Aquibacillus halophilus]MRH41092.1 hypothetical protein [Aquibacillus halophilus]
MNNEEKVHGDFTSRKVEHSKKSSRLPYYLDIWGQLLYVISLIVLVSQVNYSIILWALFLSPLALIKYIRRNIWSISILFFILVPSILSFFILTLISPFLSEASLWITLILIIPLTSLLVMLLFGRSDEFIQKARVSLEINQFIVIALALSTALLAYQYTEFNFLLPFFSVDNLTENGFNPRDAFNFIGSSLFLPYLVSTALCKALLEWFDFKQKKGIKE